MPEARAMRYDPARPLSVSVEGQSPHVFAYRFWARPPGASDWTLLAEGQTEDAAPDAFDAGVHPDGTRIAWWTGIGGRKATSFRLVVTFSQDGKVIPGGVDVVAGQTSEEGGAAVERESLLAAELT